MKCSITNQWRTDLLVEPDMPVFTPCVGVWQLLSRAADVVGAKGEAAWERGEGGGAMTRRDLVTGNSVLL